MKAFATPSATLKAQVKPRTGIFKRAGLLAAFAALVALLLMPAPQGLPPAGQVMLAILAFAVIVWMTEALDYAVSAVVISALMIFLLAYMRLMRRSPWLPIWARARRSAWPYRGFPTAPSRW